MLPIPELHPQPVHSRSTLDLDAAGARLREQPAWREHGHAAATLVRERALRVVLIELRAGAHIAEHRTGAQVSIQALRGRVQLVVGDRTVSLTGSQVLVLDAGVAHDVHADTDAALLLTLAFGGLS